jgi:hypothetical protein
MTMDSSWKRLVKKIKRGKGSSMIKRGLGETEKESRTTGDLVMKEGNSAVLERNSSPVGGALAEESCTSKATIATSRESTPATPQSLPTTPSALEGEQYGMFIFQPKPSDQGGLVDIVAIHGLGGHYQKTWTWEPSERSIGEPHNWLRESLPKQIPAARIMSFGYNSTVWLSRSIADIQTFAEQLILGLDINRKSDHERKRPIIFVCHSLGGIVAKRVC